MRITRHRNRRRKGLRCITIELREIEVDVLIRRGRLFHEERGDPARYERPFILHSPDRACRTSRNAWAIRRAEHTRLKSDAHH